MYDRELSALVEGAFNRLWVEAKKSGNCLGDHIINWVRRVYPTDKPEYAFIEQGAYPLLLLPWYAERTFQPEPDPEFQSQLIYSTINGYYYIRLLDNIIDGHSANNPSLLLTLSFFHSQFQSPYTRYFGHEHPFWDCFHAIWMHSADVTMRDMELMDIDYDTFISVCAQKTSAVKIPLAAVFHCYNQPDRIAAWSRFVDLFGCWHQMGDDIVDWIKDIRQDTNTFFLSQAQNQKKPDEPVLDWVIREGFQWGMGLMDGWMDELQETARDLESPELQSYLEMRSELHANHRAENTERLKQLNKLLSGFRRALDLPDS